MCADNCCLQGTLLQHEPYILWRTTILSQQHAHDSLEGCSCCTLAVILCNMCHSQNLLVMNLVRLAPSQIEHFPPAYKMTHLLDHAEILQMVFNGLTISNDLHVSQVETTSAELHTRHVYSLSQYLLSSVSCSSKSESDTRLTLIASVVAPIAT